MLCAHDMDVGTEMFCYGRDRASTPTMDQHRNSKSGRLFMIKKIKCGMICVVHEEKSQLLEK